MKKIVIFYFIILNIIGVDFVVANEPKKFSLGLEVDWKNEELLKQAINLDKYKNDFKWKGIDDFKEESNKLLWGGIISGPVIFINDDFYGYYPAEIILTEKQLPAHITIGVLDLPDKAFYDFYLTKDNLKNQNPIKIKTWSLGLDHHEFYGSVKRKENNKKIKIWFIFEKTTTHENIVVEPEYSLPESIKIHLPVAPYATYMAFQKMDYLHLPFTPKMDSQEYYFYTKKTLPIFYLQRVLLSVEQRMKPKVSSQKLWAGINWLKKFLFDDAQRLDITVSSNPGDAFILLARDKSRKKKCTKSEINVSKLQLETLVLRKNNFEDCHFENDKLWQDSSGNYFYDCTLIKAKKKIHDPTIVCLH